MHALLPVGLAFQGYSRAHRDLAAPSQPRRKNSVLSAPTFALASACRVAISHSDVALYFALDLSHLTDVEHAIYVCLFCLQLWGPDADQFNPHREFQPEEVRLRRTSHPIPSHSI